MVSSCLSLIPYNSSLFWIVCFACSSTFFLLFHLRGSSQMVYHLRWCVSVCFFCRCSVTVPKIHRTKPNENWKLVLLDGAHYIVQHRSIISFQMMLSRLDNSIDDSIEFPSRTKTEQLHWIQLQRWWWMDTDWIAYHFLVNAQISQGPTSRSQAKQYNTQR